MIRSRVLGENPYTQMTDAEFLAEYDVFIANEVSIRTDLNVQAGFTMALLVEYNRRFRPVVFATKKPKGNFTRHQYSYVKHRPV